MQVKQLNRRDLSGDRNILAGLLCSLDTKKQPVELIRLDVGRDDEQGL